MTVSDHTAKNNEPPEGAIGDDTPGKHPSAVPEITPQKQPVPAGERPRFPKRVKLASAQLEHGRLVLQGTEAEHAAVGAALGSGSTDFQSYSVAQLLAVLPGKRKMEDYSFLLNSALAMLAGIDPRDEFEAMVALQMVAAHHASMELTGYTVRTDRQDSKQLNGNLANKFSRTFAALSEALARHRRGGKQIVEHVHVNAGGQAVIAGTLNTRG